MKQIKNSTMTKYSEIPSIAEGYLPTTYLLRRLKIPRSIGSNTTWGMWLMVFIPAYVVPAIVIGQLPSGILKIP
jgi:hypothetical protein